MTWEINQNADLKASMAPSAFYDSPLITGDADAHKWRVTVTENGSPADLSGGTITGNFLRSDGSMVAVQGSLEGNVAGLVMPNACYGIEGPMKAVMKFVRGSQTITLAVISLYVKLMAGETIVDPGETIPDINVLLAKIAEMEAATQAANEAAERADLAVDNIPGEVTAQIDHRLGGLTFIIDPSDGGLNLVYNY